MAEIYNNVYDWKQQQILFQNILFTFWQNVLWRIVTNFVS